MPRIEIDVTDGFLEVIDTIAESEGYMDRGEFIREAIREKLKADVAQDTDGLAEKLKDLLGKASGGSGDNPLGDIIGKVIGRE